MISTRSLLCLGVVVAVVALSCNHCSLNCLVKFVSGIPIVGDCLTRLLPLTGGVSVKRATPDLSGGEPAALGDTDSKDTLFTADELKHYKGEKGLYLSILGVVYDVKKGERHYAEGGAYHHFAGIDGSRAFITGDFTEAGLRDDVLDFTPDQFITLETWAGNYKRDYPPVGKMIGRYYDENGDPTEYMQKVLDGFANAHDNERIKEERNKKYPPCNSRWIQEEGGSVWCTDLSGGIQRGWSGVPRQLFEKETGKTRCACVQLHMVDDPDLKEYENCPKDSESCPLPANRVHPGMYFDEGQNTAQA